MKKEINFDMDGTIADFYGVEGWLDDLIAQSPRPYAEAKPLLDMDALADRLNKLQNKGYAIKVISWLSKTTTEEFDSKVIATKKEWLQKNLSSVKWDKIDIVAYGTPKQTLGKGILFDDEKQNRENWGKGAYEPTDIFKVLDSLI
jgi:hypothetical protein